MIRFDNYLGISPGVEMTSTAQNDNFFVLAALSPKERISSRKRICHSGLSRIKIVLDSGQAGMTVCFVFTRIFCPLRLCEKRNFFIFSQVLSFFQKTAIQERRGNPDKNKRSSFWLVQNQIHKLFFLVISFLCLTFCFLDCFVIPFSLSNIFVIKEVFICNYSISRKDGERGIAFQFS